jgi:hypothetical protein
MWSAPVQRQGPDGSNYSLVLLDTEGIDAYDQASKFDLFISDVPCLGALGQGPGQPLLPLSACHSQGSRRRGSPAVAFHSLPTPSPPAPPPAPTLYCPADGAVQHPDLLPGCPAVQPVCVQPDGGHRRGGAGQVGGRSMHSRRTINKWHNTVSQPRQHACQACSVACSWQPPIILLSSMSYLSSLPPPSVFAPPGCPW